MAETLWDAITDLLAPEAGRRRRAALDRAVGEAVMGLLGPTGIPERLAPVAEAVNPVASMERAGQASQRVFDPSLDRSQRIAAGGEMLSEMAGTALPGFLAARYGAPAAQAIEETLLGFSQPARDAGSAIVERLNQPGQGGGPVTLYSNPFMRAPDDALPTPRNDAEAMAREILEMRAAGRAGEVTDEMMAAADPQYMYANTPLPMDYESRMARAREMGLSFDTFHGTPAAMQIDALRPSASGEIGPGVYHTRSPEYAAQYARRYDAEGDLVGLGQVIPLRTVEPQMMTRRDWVDRRGAAMDAIRAERGGEWSSNIPQAAADRMVNETGGNVYFEGSAGFDNQGVTFDPRNIRSRFARFDPEFRHLRNLSAGFGGLGLLAYPEEEQ